ncbi:MAG: tetratricopeptide repeat protein [Ruegeria sp.]
MRHATRSFKPFANALKLAALSVCLAAPLHAQDAAEIAFWEAVSGSGSAAQLQAYVDAYPDGVFRALAEIKIKEIQRDTIVERNTASDRVQEDCDRLAGHAGDETLPVAATSARDLMAHAEAAIKACKAAVKTSENPRYDFQLGRAYWASGDAIKAWNWYLQASLKGHQRATYRLALTLYNGNAAVSRDFVKIPVDINIPEALKTFKENADRGHPDSAFYTGWILAMGEATGTNDLEAALPYLLQAEQAGVTRGLVLLGYMYENGLHVPPSERKAVDYYRRAIVAQADLWPNARTGLIRLLLYRLKNPDVSSSEPRADILNEALELMAAYHTEDTVRLHNVYTQVIVEEAIRSAGVLSVKAGMGDWPYDPYKDADGHLAELDRLLGRLKPALSARHSAFPDQFPEQTDARIAKLVASFEKALKARIFAEFDYDRFVDHVRNDAAILCVAKTTEFDGRVLYSSIRNLCDYDVIVRLRHRVKYADGTFDDRADVFEAALRPDQSDTFRTAPRNPAQVSQGGGDLMACYEQEGFNDIEDFSLSAGERDKHCGIDFIDARKDREAKIEADMDRLASAIIGLPEN